MASLPAEEHELRNTVLRMFWDGESSLHVEDPIAFERSIRVALETGHDNALANDYSSTAYWYQLGRSEPLPPLPPAALQSA